jgi:hypothetical protein
MTEKSRAVGIEHQLLQCLQCNTQFDEEDRLPTKWESLFSSHLQTTIMTLIYKIGIRQWLKNPRNNMGFCYAISNH